MPATPEAEREREGKIRKKKKKGENNTSSAMTAASNRDGATGLARRPECACRKGDGIRIFALMKAGVQAHHWSRVLFLYMGLLAASVKGK